MRRRAVLSRKGLLFSKRPGHAPRNWIERFEFSFLHGRLVLALWISISMKLRSRGSLFVLSVTPNNWKVFVS